HFVIDDGEVALDRWAEKKPYYLAGSRGGDKGGGWFDNSPFRVAEDAKPDQEGNLESSRRDSWVRKLPELWLVAWDKQILNEVAPLAKFREAERDAQLRLQVVDLADAKVAPFLNAEGYMRARKVSGGNTDFMHVLIQQLHVEEADARDVAEQLLNARLVCPLDGSYRQKGKDRTGWSSTAWKTVNLSDETRVPAGYQAPLVKWFGGLLLEFTAEQNTLSTHIELDIRTD
ncbi:MAG: hypothetical protein N2C12_15770, partial [Planctomycetales bacterium]